MNHTPHTLTDIKAMIDADRLNDALEAINAYIAANPDDAQALFARGKLKWRMGHRSDAQNDYLASSALDPDGPATAALESARDIEAFFNPDLLNP